MLALDLRSALERYQLHLGIRGYRLGGIATTSRYILEFIEWCEQRAATFVEQVTRDVIERYHLWIHQYRKRDGRPLAAAGQRCKLIPLRGFFKWLARTRLVAIDPAGEMELPKASRRLPRSVLSTREVEQVMAAVELDTPVGVRDRTMLEVLYATGIRRMEIANLEIGDVDLMRKTVLVREGKGGKDRVIPIGERAARWVGNYLETARPALARKSAVRTLFLGAEGNPLSVLWLSTTVANRVRASGIEKRGGCHIFRHTMATLMLEGGADIRCIQAMLGHAELSTTQIYTHVAVANLAQVHAMAHPGVAGSPA